jgi:hypothetical protein
MKPSIGIPDLMSAERNLDVGLPHPFDFHGRGFDLALVCHSEQSEESV